MRPVSRRRSRVASSLSAAALILAAFVAPAATIAAGGRGRAHPTREPIDRRGGARHAIKRVPVSRTRSSTPTLRRSAAAPRAGRSRGGAAPAPHAGSGTGASSPPSAPPPAPVASWQEASEEAPEPSEEPVAEAGEEAFEADSATPAGEEGEEAMESEEAANEAPSGEEEQRAEDAEVPGPDTIRKYAGELPEDSGEETLLDAIDPRFLTYVRFGTTSFWIQPWRAYTDTWPASRLLNSLGINFAGTGSDSVEIAQLLHDSGFVLARRGVFWDAVSYKDPSTLRNPAHMTAALALLHSHGLRPLIVLDADSLAPAPSIRITLETLSNAPEGAQTVQLSATSAAKVIPWKTGFNNLAFAGPADILITSADANGVATLSRPLRKPLPAGVHGATTLRYTPFEYPKLADGQPNPVFQETLDGWLKYVDAVCKAAAGVVGPGGFDLEVWNELSYDSQFLNIEHYEAPNPEPKAKRLASKAIRRAILDETVAYVRNPANGISPAVGITDGFASQTPFPSGAAAPIGLTALSKHPYVGAKTYPAAYAERHTVPVDALGTRDTVKGGFTPLFVPAYQSLMPEFTISGNFSEDLLRDVAPFTTYVYGFPHGRFVGPPGGTPPQKWITEFNLGPGHGIPMSPDEVTPAAGVTLSAADRAHFQAKALLRDVVAMVGKGFARDYIFHAAQTKGALNVVGSSFLGALEAHPGTYPGDGAGGETLSGFREMLARFQGPGPGGPARQLQIVSIAQQGEHAQFAGDGTAAHPPLYDRDALAVLPFQSSPTRFVIPIYVMTRDLLTLYEPDAAASDVERYDLPDESFRVTLGNLPATAGDPTVSAFDPLRGTSTPARLVSREGTDATFEIAATDYPRILTLQFPAS
jgi:hypothetical protein